MNKDKAYFEENAQGDLLYAPSVQPKFRKLTESLINKDVQAYGRLSTALFGSFVKERKAALGKQTFYTSDSANRRLYVWKLNFNSGMVWVLSASGRGTSYEYNCEAGKAEQLYDELMEFVDTNFMSFSGA